MDTLPELERLSAQEKDALIVALWAELQRLRTRLADVEAKLVELLGDPATCPHGNPIPGSSHRVDTRSSVALTQATPGQVRVTRISEKIEIDDEAIALLARVGLVPGMTASVVRVDASGVVVKSQSGEQTVPNDVARLTFVAPV